MQRPCNFVSQHPAGLKWVPQNPGPWIVIGWGVTRWDRKTFNLPKTRTSERFDPYVMNIMVHIPNEHHRVILTFGQLILRTICVLGGENCDVMGNKLLYHNQPIGMAQYFSEGWIHLGVFEHYNTDKIVSNRQLISIDFALSISQIIQSDWNNISAHPLIES